MTVGMSVPAMAEESGDAEYAVILKTQATDFWVKMWKGVEAEAEAKGVKLTSMLHRARKTLKDSWQSLRAVFPKDTKVSQSLLFLP